ncbi:TetR/AcrR family transcriptional regulator [Herbiconiux sp. A18JL235]|uniref:TetR/AcrR family transcriptional regulator n=1 Tax=Herbiconiux sp. A18JL235 TaxID=3152363 RepID=A0AB39BDM5_9MICO
MTAASGANEELRRTLRDSPDPRVARTRTAIAAAVHALSDAGEVLSVAAIVRTAGISRASFYAHYADLDELANGLRRDAFLTIADLYQHDDRPDAMRTSQDRLVAHFAGNRALYAAAGALPTTKEGYLAGVRAMAAVIEEALAGHPSRPSDLDPEATARYISGAAYGLLDAWITGEIALSEERLADHLTRLLPSWFSGVR